MRARLFLFLLVFLGTVQLIFPVPQPEPAMAQAGDASALVAAVNQLRAAYGLPALEVNSTLMYIAQTHSEYQASIGEVTHYGPGGSRPKERATAAGYGGGATFFISENIAGGTNLSAQEAVSLWTGDSLHWNTMMGENYREIGAGVAVSGGFVYYTIDVAYVAGSGSSVSPSATPGPGTPSATPGPSPIPIYAVITATPNPDGSIIHVVQSGQTLITIAQAYQVTVQEIKVLNGLSGDDIYVGDQLIIYPAYTPTPTGQATETRTQTPGPTSTRRPTRTASPSATLQTRTPSPDAPHSTPTAPPVGSFPPDRVGNFLIGAVIVLAVLGLGLMAAGTLIKRL
jgi:LysM repeat protein